LGDIDMRRTENLRRDVARDARLYLASQISWDEFIGRYGEADDDDHILQLVDLIEHEPKRGGVLGVSEDMWRTYRAQVEQLLQTLESSRE